MTQSMSTWESLFSLLGVSLRDHQAACISLDSKFLTATVIFTEHSINAMPLEANLTVSPSHGECSHMREVRSSAILIISNKNVKAKPVTEVQLVYHNGVR